MIFNDFHYCYKFATKC